MFIAPNSLDTDLDQLLLKVHQASIQLPEFQRDWTWDDNRIRGIIASLAQGYPMGAIMRLQYGNDDVKFKYRTIEGVAKKDVVPEYLILDGQQRLTSIYRALYSKTPVNTKNDKDKPLERYYYIDIKKALSENEDMYDAILSIPKDKKVKENFDRDVVLDISTSELEFKHGMFPLNIIFDSGKREDWSDGYKEYHGHKKEINDKYKKFRSDVLDAITKYKLPVITLDKTTPREAVCKVFENVNTGGVPLTVFELVTATFAADGFDLRKDWENYKETIWGTSENLRTDILSGVDETEFLTAVTLYSSYIQKRPGKGFTSCKKKDVLLLSLKTYKDNRDKIIAGYKLARKFLTEQSVYRKRDLPYQTQLIPLSAICAFIGESKFNKPETQKILKKWYWCGIFGEMYGGANETRYANDIEDVVAEITSKPTQNRTINGAFFSATRLLSMRTRQSAAYKGMMAILYDAQCLDFVKGKPMTLTISMDETPDIHHIFPQDYCEKKKYDKIKWDSIINKTPLLAETNRAIGGVAPSAYKVKILKEAKINETELAKRIESHKVNYSFLIADDFGAYFIDRTKKLLVLIESAMGKKISDRASEETIKQYGDKLTDEDGGNKKKKTRMND
jgi:hypothetical protein